MINIVLCDDDPIVHDIILAKLNSIIPRTGIEYTFNSFYDGRNLLKSYYEVSNYNLFIIDIVMPIMNGFELAGKLREISGEILILFLTSSVDMVFSSFKYSPHRYIRKKYLDDEFEEAVISSIKIIQQRNMFYSFTCEVGERLIKLRDILYIEVLSRKVYIHLMDKEFVVKDKFKKLANEFPSDKFVDIYRGCILNLEFIKCIGAISVTLVNNKMLPISRYKINDVKDAFNRFLGGM